ncbi:hypothetical protein F503_03940 [Ophiostoma piceae UAMH 11346]|uniref:Uncharacterized protein n=1 Tax=Ophiostoma piceae (strain UAMH 11346) TaxID=1262450 RepID=S3CP43_OPHP1|nr:hypothetical protein F503_03940 [Ophiostoma piceae UAMH 11346]
MCKTIMYWKRWFCGHRDFIIDDIETCSEADARVPAVPCSISVREVVHDYGEGEEDEMCNECYDDLCAVCAPPRSAMYHFYGNNKS